MGRRKPKAPCIVVPSILAGPAVTDLLEELKATRGNDVTLDLKDVEQVGTPVLQLVLSAIRTWQQDGHTLKLANATDVFASAVRDAALELELGTEV